MTKTRTIEIRNTAEELFRKSLQETLILTNDEKDSFIEEMKLHEIELKLQNTELIKMQNELRQIKDNYAELYDLAPFADLTLDYNSNIVDINKTGIIDLELSTSSNLNINFNKFVADDFKVDYELWFKSIITNRSKCSAELKLVIGNRNMDIKLSGYYLPKPKVIRTVFIDITDQKNKERELAKALEELEIANNQNKKYALELEKNNTTKEKLLSIVSHDLRGPLSVLTLIDKDLIDDIRANCDSVSNDKITLLSKSSKYIFGMLENLLTWVQLQRNKIAVNKQQIDISYIIDSVIDSLRPTAKAKDITIIIEMPKSCYYDSDINILQSIFTNLIYNAIKFSNQQSKINIVLEKYNDYLLFKVEDSGIGIPSERIKTLFDPKYASSSTGTAKETGSGLGLILTYEFINMLNGKINVQSEIGKGTTFTVLLPN